MRKPSKFHVAIVGCMICSCAQQGSAGNKTSVAPNGFGHVQSDVTYGSAKEAQMPANWVGSPSPPPSVFKPASGVNATASTNFASSIKTANVEANTLPEGAASANLAQVTTPFYPGGYKALARVYVVGGATAGNPELQQKLADQNFEIVPPQCGASYNIASGGELIDGKPFLVVFGNATEGTAAWFRAFANGKMLYEVLLTGPFDFGDVDNPDYCKAGKFPFTHNGDLNEVIFIADTLAISTTDLQITCPAPIQASCGQAVYYPTPTTSGGCGDVTISYNPPQGSVFSPGTHEVLVTATDGAGNQAACTFKVFVNVGFDGFRAPIDGVGGDCTQPVRLCKLGSNIPFKFSLSCGESLGATPTFRITRCGDTAWSQTGVCQFVAGEWHGQFDTSQLGVKKGVYRFEVRLQAQVIAYVYINLK